MKYYDLSAPVKAHLLPDILIRRDDLFDEVSGYEMEGLLLNWLQGSSVTVLRERVTLEGGGGGRRERERDREGGSKRDKQLYCF